MRKYLNDEKIVLEVIETIALTFKRIYIFSSAILEWLDDIRLIYEHDANCFEFDKFSCVDGFF